ncbi:rhomboid family intramembrane serine protease [Rhodobacteraceae bacterium 63075]|nr:rhomboid family intramembrane serine protease [Rhodobacteraceae bacterium 63075]
MRPERAVNDISPAVAGLFGLIVAVELVLTLAGEGVVGGRMGIGWRVQAIQDYGLTSELVAWMLETGRWPPEHLLRFFTYPFLHGGFVHMVFSGAILLAMGKFVGDRFSGLSILVLFFACSAIGGLVWGALPTSRSWLIGAFPAVYGLIGAFTYILWVNYRAVGEQQIKAFQLIGMLLLIRIILGLLLGDDGTWSAELAGFATGFLLSFVLRPGGVKRLREMMRRG